MDETDKKILGEYSGKRQRPRLLQNSELILGLYERGATLKEIANTLNEKKHISVPICTLSRFIAQQEQGTPKRRKPKPQEITQRGETTSFAAPTVSAGPPTAKTASPDANWREKIEALKIGHPSKNPLKSITILIPTSLLLL